MARSARASILVLGVVAFLGFGAMALRPAVGPVPPEPAASSVEAGAPGASRAADLVAEAERANNVGQTQEARRLYAAAEAIYAQSGDDDGLASVFLGLGNLEGYLGQSDPARTAYSKALQHYRQSDNPLGEAAVLAAMGDLAKTTLQFAEARTAFREARAAFARAGPAAESTHLLFGLERVVSLPNGEGRGALTEARLLYQQIDDPSGVALVALLAADLEAGVGSYESAMGKYVEAVQLYAAVDDPAGVAGVRLAIGIETHYGYVRTARSALETAAELFEQLGDRHGQAETDAVLGRFGRVVSRTGEARAAYERAARLFRESGDTAGEGAALAGLAEVARLSGDLDAAATAFAAALVLLPDPGSARAHCSDRARPPPRRGMRRRRAPPWKVLWPRLAPLAILLAKGGQRWPLGTSPSPKAAWSRPQRPLRGHAPCSPATGSDKPLPWPPSPGLAARMRAPCANRHKACSPP